MVTAFDAVGFLGTLVAALFVAICGAFSAWFDRKAGR